MKDPRRNRTLIAMAVFVLCWPACAIWGQDESNQTDDRTSEQQSLDPEYLRKWTPTRRKESRFPYEKETDDDWFDDRFQAMDTGPTFCGSIETPGRGKTPKAIAISLADRDVAVLFDTQRLYVRAGWTGDFLKLPPKRFGMLLMPSIEGKVEFSADWNGGWSWEEAGKSQFLQPGVDGRFQRYSLNGDDSELVYSVKGTSFREQHVGKIIDPNYPCFLRKIETNQNAQPLRLSLIQTSARLLRLARNDDFQIVALNRGDECWLAYLKGTQTRLVYKDGGKQCDVSVEFPQSDGPISAEIAIVKIPTESLNKVLPMLAEAFQFPSVESHAPRWGEPLETTGRLSSDSKPFVVDEITVPYENRYKALMYTSAFDFVDAETAFVSTMHGDVWKVTGIDESLEQIRWQRFATGLYQPLGLKVIGGKAYVLGRDRITVLEDVNDDGEADHYHNFCDLLDVNGQPHAYAMSLETDRAGNFYFIKSGGSPPHGGTMLKVSPDGKQIEVVATGYRHANGLGVGPNDEITSADNEGNWIPSTRIDLVKPGGFYGHMPTHRRQVKPENYDGPLCWVPRLIDNSAGGQVWVDSESWGPLNKQMLHLSYGRCTVNLVLPENVEGVDQAGILKLDLPTLLSGSMRGRFSKHDGHLYVVGLDGWQTAAVRDGCFQRVRASGQPMYLPVGLKARNQGIEITFSDPVDVGEAKKVANWNVQQWNYRWTKEYGSDHFRVSNPKEVGHDDVPISEVHASEDGRTVTLFIPDLKPVMQMQITGRIKALDGKVIPVQLFNTIHRLGD